MSNSIKHARTVIFGVGAVMLATLFSGPVNAEMRGAQPPRQPGAPATQAPPQAGPGAATSGDVDEQQLAQFVDVYEDIVAIQKNLMSGLNDARSSDKANALQQQARAKMVRTVKSSPLSMDEFNSIMLGMQRDRKLQARIEAAMNTSH